MPASPIYRPTARRCASQADKSAMCTINRHLRNDRFWSLKFIIGGVREALIRAPLRFAEAPTGIQGICLKPIINALRLAILIFDNTHYLKMLSGRYADTIQLGASTTSLIFRSTAAPPRQEACSRVIWKLVAR